MLRRDGLTAAILCSLFLLPAVTCAQAGKEYDRSIKAAVSEFEAGNFSEARALFQQAHALQPSARTLRGLGISAAELRLYVEAVDALEAALAHRERPLTQAQRAEVEEVLQRARLSVARIALSTDPADAEVTVDGRAVQRRDGQLWLNPGEYTFRANAPGFAPKTRVVQAISGTQTLSLTLEPSATAADAAQSEAPASQALPEQTSAAPPEALEPSAGRDGLPVLFWVTAAGAVAFGGAALAMHLVAQGEADDIERDCPVAPVRACSRAEIGRRIDDAGIPTLNVLTGVALGLAGASAVAAALTIVIDTGGEAQPVSVTLSPRGANVGVRF